jgi:hypothetical protein
VDVDGTIDDGHRVIVIVLCQFVAAPVFEYEHHDSLDSKYID